MNSKLTFMIVAGAAIAAFPVANASETEHAAEAVSNQSRVFASTEASHGDVAPVASIASASQGHTQPAGQDHAAASAPSQGGSHWEYSGSTGPDQWGTLSAEFGQCSGGRMQSPINISQGLPAQSVDIKFDYSITDLTIRNNGHTIQVDYQAGSGILVDGNRYELLQLHFHTPSEHLVDGKTYPMEMHLVHKDASGALAVVGVMMESGNNNVALSEVWNHLPASAGEPTRIGGVAINARDLLPAQGSYHHYKGSLTTPPCSEGVNWFVLAQPVQVSASQINSFMDIIGENARPTQPVNNRLLISEK